MGCDVAQIVKSLVFIADERPVIAFTGGEPGRSGQARGRGRRVGDAPGHAGGARAATGFAVGGTPPFGHPAELPGYVDPDLLAFEEVWVAAGTPDSVFPLAPPELLRVTGHDLPDFTEG